MLWQSAQAVGPVTTSPWNAAVIPRANEGCGLTGWLARGHIPCKWPSWALKLSHLSPAPSPLCPSGMMATLDLSQWHIWGRKVWCLRSRVREKRDMFRVWRNYSKITDWLTTKVTVQTFESEMGAVNNNPWTTGINQEVWSPKRTLMQFTLLVEVSKKMHSKNNPHTTFSRLGDTYKQQKYKSCWQRDDFFF